MSDEDREAERHGRLFDQLRASLLDASHRDPLLDYRHRVGSRRQVRIVDCDLESVFVELAGRRRELPVVALAAPSDMPDERSPGFLAALARARAFDAEYLSRLASLDALGRRDDAAQAEVDRWLRDHVRAALGMAPQPYRFVREIADHARAQGVEPSYDLFRRMESRPPPALQTLHAGDELDARLARMAADARLSEEETGLSTLRLAFGFVRWYEAAGSEAARFAPLLLLPVALARRIEERQATYFVRATAEFPELDPTLPAWFLRVAGAALPEFDPETDGIESYLARVAQAIGGLDRWQIERHLTLGHFVSGRLALHADLAPENWSGRPAAHPLVADLFRGWVSPAGAVSFEADYDLDDEAVEDTAPILIEDADAAQHSAVVDVMRGKNLVIEGPPGTGTSQTIANIVANALFAGKTVLFVADKVAAIEAVKWRMDVAGLGDFCLELHSDKARPAAVLEGLRHRYDLGRDRGYEPAWTIDVKKLRRARGRVREYLGALHAAGEGGAPSAFELFWPAVAARREYAREFAAVHRVDLSEIFAASREKIAASADALKLFGDAVESYEQQHGRFADAPWTPAGFAPAPDSDPHVLAESIREAHDAATALIWAAQTAAAKLSLTLPRLPSQLAGWVEAVRRLPPVPDDTLLARLSSFSAQEIMAAADLAGTRLGLESGGAEAPPAAADPAVLARLLEEAEGCGAMAVQPAQIDARIAAMTALEPSLVDGLAKLSSAIDAIAPGAEPNVGAARAFAAAAQFAEEIAPELDGFLGFDGTGQENVLADGAQRVRLLEDTERTLARKFRRNERGEWPALEDVQLAADVATATGLRPLAALVTGQRKRANQVLQRLGVAADTPDLQSDLTALMFHLEARQRLRNDDRLAAAAGGFWAQAATPFQQLEAATRLRSAFDARMAHHGEIGATLKSVLFSSDAGVVAKLRAAQPWLAQLRSDLDAWPEPLDALPLRQAPSFIAERIAKARQLAAGVRDAGLDTVDIPFAVLRDQARRRRHLAELEIEAARDPLFAVVGEAVWRSPAGCETLRRTGSLAQAIVDANPPPGVRARLNTVEGPSFARLLEEEAGAIELALERYRGGVTRLAATGGVDIDVDGAGSEQVVGLLAPLLPELPALPAWLETTRRRAVACDAGMEQLIAAFEAAGLPQARLAGAFAALEVFYRAVLARRLQPLLSTTKGPDIEGERARVAASDRDLQAHQREAVRIKLLGNAIPSGSCAGRKKDWTELHYIRNELAKTEKHVPLRTLLSRSRRAILAMKPCVMASPLSLATYLPPAATLFDLVIIDHASQMRPEDALGGLLRARQVVVVGDRAALPPTDVMRRATPPEQPGATDDTDADPGESLFDWALRAIPVRRRFTSHYRSRCASLVAFANRAFYASAASPAGTLATPPNVRPGAFSIDLVRVDGTFEAGRNVAEVDRVVAAAIDFMIRNADLPPAEMPTLGIAALGRAQRDAICDEFNRAARHPAIERYLAACAVPTAARPAEPFFIKDVENVEGDARDVIMVSLTAGRERGEPGGALRFGPISSQRGASRINVLSTRARRSLVLFSSLASGDAADGAAGNPGIRALHDYLRYVEDREVATPAPAERASDCQHEIAARLEAKGYAVDLAEGSFGVDLAVRHPRDPGRYLAGIATDGPAFARVNSARERDRLRDEVLAERGWSILRVWSADWFASPQGWTAKLLDDLARLAEGRREADPAQAPPQEPGEGAPSTAPALEATAAGGGEDAAADPLTAQGASP